MTEKYFEAAGRITLMVKIMYKNDKMHTLGLMLLHGFFVNHCVQFGRHAHVHTLWDTE